MNNPVASTDIIRVRPSVFLSLFHYFTLFFCLFFCQYLTFYYCWQHVSVWRVGGAPLLSYIYIFTFKACMNNVLHFYILLVIHTWKKLRQQTMESIIKKKRKKAPLFNRWPLPELQPWCQKGNNQSLDKPFKEMEKITCGK